MAINIQEEIQILTDTGIDLDIAKALVKAKIKKYRKNAKNNNIPYENSFRARLQFYRR